MGIDRPHGGDCPEQTSLVDTVHLQALQSEERGRPLDAVRYAKQAVALADGLATPGQRDGERDVQQRVWRTVLESRMRTRIAAGVRSTDL